MAPTDPENTPPPPAHSPLLKVFIGPQGLRAGWRVLLFFVLAVLLVFFAGGIAGIVLRGLHAGAAQSLLWGNLAAAAAIFAVTALMIRVDRVDDPTATIARAGLGAAGAIRNAAAGAVCGFVALTVLIGALRAAGLYTIQQPVWDASVFYWAIYWGVQFLCTGLLEEISMRGYPLAALSRGIGFWPAAFLLSLLFAAGHLGNNGEAWTGIGNAVLVGLAFCWTVRFTGSLWWAIGAHAAWDWAETYFWGVSDSGFGSSHHLFAGKPLGAELLSGGSVGPEGSLLCIPAIGLLLLLARATGYRAPVPDPPPLESILGEGPLCQLPEDGQ